MHARLHALLVLLLTALVVGCFDSSGPAGDVFVILGGPTGDISSALGVEPDQPQGHVRPESIELVGESGEVVSAEISQSLTSTPSGWRGLAGVLEDVPVGTYAELRVHLAWAGSTYDFGWPGNAELPSPAHIDIVLDAPLEVVADRDALIELVLDVDHMIESIPDAVDHHRLVPAVVASGNSLETNALPLRIAGMIRAAPSDDGFVMCTGDWINLSELDLEKCFAIEIDGTTGMFGYDGEPIEATSLIELPEHLVDPGGAVDECDQSVPTYLLTTPSFVRFGGVLHPIEEVSERPCSYIRIDAPDARRNVPFAEVTVLGHPVLQGDAERADRNADGLRIVRAVSVLKGGAFAHMTLPGELYRTESDELFFDSSAVLPEAYDGGRLVVLGEGARIFDRQGVEVEGLPEGDDVWSVIVDAAIAPHLDLEAPAYWVSFARREEIVDREEEDLSPFGQARVIVEAVDVEAGELILRLGPSRVLVTAILAEDVQVRFAYVTHDEGAVSRPGSIGEIEPGMRLGIGFRAESPIGVEAIVAFSEPTHPGSCIDSFDCAAAEYCARAAGFCEDRGVCRLVRGFCSTDPAPLCSCAGVTYANSCELPHGLIRHQGVCAEP